MTGSDSVAGDEFGRSLTLMVNGWQSVAAHVSLTIQTVVERSICSSSNLMVRGWKLEADAIGRRDGLSFGGAFDLDGDRLMVGVPVAMKLGRTPERCYVFGTRVR
ncbi:MAG: hypothetical protein R3C05_08680 [Pirellulaceae bacterium]